MHSDTRQRKAAAGFTLIELMVVIAIIAMLATIVGVRLSTQVDESGQTAARAQIKNFQTALMGFKLKHKRFPDSLDELLHPPSGEPLLDGEQIPLDPWDNEYVYTLEDSRHYEIISYGADGAPGGTDVDADISSKNLQQQD